MNSSQRLAEVFKQTAAGVAEFIASDRKQRVELGKTGITLGSPFLDDAVRGAFQNDLILISAGTGMGKTEKVVHIARHNAEAGKRVHMFALEAAPGEIMRRIKYGHVADYFYRSPHRAQFQGVLNYPDWAYGLLDGYFGQFEASIDAELANRYSTLKVHYRDGAFTADTLARKLGEIKDEADLILIDHVHVVDFDSNETNENAGLKRVVRTIKDLADLHKKPIVLAAHIRKRDRRFPTLVPDIEDIHGSSDLAKIATKIVLFGPAPKAFQLPGASTKWPTLMRVGKFREDNSVAHFLGLSYFDVARRAYDPGYFIGRYVEQEQDLRFMTSREEMPYWAKQAKLMQTGIIV